MYPYEDRIRAVKLHIKLGKRTGAIIRQLGYPTKNALKSWHREFEQSQDLAAAYVRSWQKYSDEQKQAAVEHYLSHDRCIAETLKALGYPCRETLAAWIDELHPETRIHVVGKAGGVASLNRMACAWESICLLCCPTCASTLAANSARASGLRPTKSLGLALVQEQVDVAAKFVKSRTAVERRIKAIAAQLNKAVGIQGLNEEGVAFVRRLSLAPGTDVDRVLRDSCNSPVPCTALGAALHDAVLGRGRWGARPGAQANVHGDEARGAAPGRL